MPETTAMEELSNELIVYLMHFVKNKKVMRLVSRKFASIIDYIVFYIPSWKKRPFMEDISHLPIRILKISQIQRTPINHLPLSLTHFILDSIEIAPSVVNDHPETMFYISIDYLDNCSYDKSNFIRTNVKLFTSDHCRINSRTLPLYKDFTFSTLTISHIQCDETLDMLELLSDLKIERLILDRTSRPLDPIKLIKYRNIVHFSSQIFEKGKTFPLFLINKLPKLETFYCRRNTFMNFDEFKWIRMKSISFIALSYWDYMPIPNFSFSGYIHGRLFQDNTSGIRHSIYVRLTKDPPKHLLFLQKYKGVHHNHCDRVQSKFSIEWMNFPMN